MAQSAGQTITQRIALQGSEDVKRQLAELGKEGEAAIKAIDRAVKTANSGQAAFAGGIANLHAKMTQMVGSLKPVGEAIGNVHERFTRAPEQNVSRPRQHGLSRISTRCLALATAGAAAGALKLAESAAQNVRATESCSENARATRPKTTRRCRWSQRSTARRFQDLNRVVETIASRKPPSRGARSSSGRPAPCKAACPRS